MLPTNPVSPDLSAADGLRALEESASENPQVFNKTEEAAPAAVAAAPLVREEKTADVPELAAVAAAAGDPSAAADQVADEEEPEPFNFVPTSGNGNCVVEDDVYAPMPKGGWDPDAITLPLAAESLERANEYVTSLPMLDLSDTVEGSDWLSNLYGGLRHGAFNDFGTAAAKRPDATFRQAVTAGGKRLQAGRPKIKDADGPLLQGARGVLRANALMGRGSIVQIPLWNSGFWLTLRNPSEARLLEMWHRMAEEKIKYGRLTHGLAFANHSVFTVGACMDLAFDCLYETSIKDVENISELRSMIDQRDIPTIAWGLACAIWPRGFQYARSVLDENGQELKVIKELLNVGYLQWVDTSSINDWQATHMLNRVAGTMSKQTVGMYRDHFVRGKAKSFALSDTLTVTLKAPNYDGYLKSGSTWIHNIVKMVDQAFSLENDQKTRNEHVIERGKATSVRQYAHWIESFDFPTIDKKMVDEETIAAQCDELSSDDKVREKFFEVVEAFINDSTVSIIATPIVDNSERKREKPNFPWLLPMDPVSSFFTLLDQKVMQIRQRP